VIKGLRASRDKFVLAGRLDLKARAILEHYTDNEGASGARWFHWGRDLSGELEQAGGIGGLLAIIDERAGGPTRTLLPVTDGLGNITAVVDQANGQLVARYEYGPIGEHLGERGEVDVCPFRWQRKFYEKESQQYYFLYRYYDPPSGPLAVPRSPTRIRRPQPLPTAAMTRSTGMIRWGCH
jgi:hypothetical protein